MKQKINATIERADDGGIWTYGDTLDGKYGFSGFGKTPKEAIEDFWVSYEEMKKTFDDVPEIEVTFEYDVFSFLKAFKGSLTLAGLETITGVNQRQLQHYMSGCRRPSEKTVRKIEEAIHQFGATLMDVSLA